MSIGSMIGQTASVERPLEKGSGRLPVQERRAQLNYIVWFGGRRLETEGHPFD